MSRFAKPIVTLFAVATVAVFSAQPAVLAQEEEVDPATDDATEPVPVLSGYNLMATFFHDPYEALEETLAEEPADRRAWRSIRDNAYALAEASNLLFSRNDMEYMGKEEWNKLSVEGRQAAVALGDSTREQDYAKSRAAFVALVESCNKCHEAFEPDIAPIFDVE